MARAKQTAEVKAGLYERDFNLWVEEQVRLLREGRLQQLDVVNLIDEIEGLGIHEKKAVQSNLVVVLKHLLKYRYQSHRRSRSWLSSIAEHRRRLRNDLATSPSLRPYARGCFEQCYEDGRRQALIETGLSPGELPETTRSSRRSIPTSCPTERPNQRSGPPSWRGRTNPSSESRAAAAMKPIIG